MLRFAQCSLVTRVERPYNMCQATLRAHRGDGHLLILPAAYVLLSTAMSTSMLRKVKRFADEFKSKYDRLDVLVNNAGEYVPPDDTTEDGFEVWRLQAMHPEYMPPF